MVHAFRWQINKDDSNLLFPSFYLNALFNDSITVQNIIFFLLFLKTAFAKYSWPWLGAKKKGN